jgi:tetratricopeptide (TPR) repeat protein
MRKADWRTVDLVEGILREPGPDPNRLILWLPGKSEGGLRCWERIATVPGADITVEQGLCATAATALRAQQSQGFFGKLLGRFRKQTGTQTWVLPNGETAQQQGERQADLLLAWAEDESTPLDETRLRARWPEGKRFQRIGKNLFLVGGIEPQAAAGEPAQPPQVNPREQAEQLLAAARQAGDRSREASALTDLGIVCQRGGEYKQAGVLLEEALGLVRRLGERGRESDVLGNLALAVLGMGQPRRALELLEQSLALARAGGDRFAEKTTLEQLGGTYGALRDHVRALSAYDQALTLARALDDRAHEAELLWYQAIQHAEMGQRDRAMTLGEEAIGLFGEMKSPAAGWLADNLQKYRLGEVGARLAGLAEAGTGVPARPEQESGPGLLRMAMSAVKSMARFIGSGLKTVPPATQQKRLQTCATCEHHTGVRCKLCGCFTTAKAWLPHEHCPIGKWPA